MAIPVLVILGLLWAAVLVPPLFRARSERRGANSIGDFSQSLGVIGRTGGHAASRAVPPTPAPSSTRRTASTGRPTRGRAPMAEPVMSPAQRRRRDVLLTLGVVLAVTLVAAVVTGSTAVWVVQVVTDVLFVTYVALLVRMRTVAAERSAKVRYLPRRQAPQLALRRTASS